jgi:uncharacterized protein (DUF885 family)
MKLILTLTLFSFLSGCSLKETHKTPQDNSELAAMFDAYWEDHSKLFPLEATSQGDNRYNDLYPNDQTADYREKIKHHLQDYLLRLEKFQRDQLNDNDKISYDIFKYEINTELEGLKTNLWMIPFQQFWGDPLQVAQLGAGDQFQPFKTVQDYKNWLQRIEGFTHWADSSIENFRAGMKVGVVLPRVLVLKTIPQMNDMIVKDATKSVFYGPISKFPEDFSSADKVELTKLYVDAIQKKIVPTYTRLRDFLKNEYLPKSRLSHGISSIKNGADTYRYLVKSYTTTDKDPEEIYQTGLSEVKRIRAEMEKVKDQVKFKGSLRQFFENMRHDPKLTPFKTPEEVLNAFRKIHEKIRPKLATLFGRNPKTPFEIRQTEAYRQATASAEYSQGSPDGTRPGIFYVPILDASKFSIASGMESLFLHEAIPGHHYQISLQQENEGLPKFRRFSWNGAYGEGWALYTESLGKELGLYTDPYQYMGALSDEMHRAVRLVVDVAIHLKGMSREKAIAYMMNNEPIDKQGATAEVERYMAIPGQALSYKIGAIKIWELRKKYAQALGPKFKLSHFHDEYLKDGCMPLAVLERKMDNWALAYK